MGRGLTCGAALLLVASCAAETDAAHDALAEEPFIALGRDFDGFLEWRRWEINDVGTRTGHDAGEPRFIYANVEPPPFEEPFPVGSIVVKTLEVGEMASWEVHAMAKRGGGYNADGAVGWEWFDLVFDEAGATAIAWRGQGSVLDPGSYGPEAGATMACNECHGLVPTADYVFTRGVISP